MMTLDNINTFLSQILTDPNYTPSTDEYFKVVWEVYYSSTLRPQDFIKNTPLDHPFEFIYDEAIKCVESTMKNSLENDLTDPENKELRVKHLKTLIKRKRVINHVFRYIDNKRLTFLKKPYNCCKISDYIMTIYFHYFRKYLSKDTPELIGKAVSAISTLFEEDNSNCDFIFFENLFYLIRAATKGLSSMQLEKEKNNQSTKTSIIAKSDMGHFSDEYFIHFIEEIHALFLENTKNVKVNLIPSITDKVYQFANSFRDLKVKSTINNLLYDSILKPRQEMLAELVNKCSMIEILDGKHPFEKQLIKVLSFHKGTAAFAEALFSRFADEFLKPLESMALIRDLAEQMINLLNYVKEYKGIIYNLKEAYNAKGSFDGFMFNELGRKLREAAFNPKFGGKQKKDGGYQVVLAFIVDAFLKRGNKFKKAVKPEDVVQLLSFVEERDIFLQHHTHNMFIRLATRSTVGLEYEESFLNKISELVAGNNIKTATELIASGKEIIYSPKFNYIYLKRQMAPPTSKYPRFPLPKEYSEFVDSVTNSLKKKYQAYQFEWIHYLSTANIILTTNGKKSFLVTSVAQIPVIKVLTNHPSVTFDDLLLLVGFDSGYLEVLVRSLVNAKMVTIEGNEQGKNNIKTGIIKFRNNFFQRKGIITDNWTPKAIKVKNIDIRRMKCAQAAIVKIMKEFRMMKTQQLIERIIEEMSKLFPISVAEIQSCLRGLIADEYLEEQDDSHLSYKE